MALCLTYTKPNADEDGDVVAVVGTLLALVVELYGQRAFKGLLPNLCFALAPTFVFGSRP